MDFKYMPCLHIGLNKDQTFFSNYILVNIYIYKYIDIYIYNSVVLYLGMNMTVIPKVPSKPAPNLSPGGALPGRHQPWALFGEDRGRPKPCRQRLGSSNSQKTHAIRLTVTL